MLVAALGFALCGALPAQRKELKKKNLLAIGQSKGFQHDTVSHGLAVRIRQGPRVLFGARHTEEAWNHPDVQKMYLEAIKWSMGMTDGDNLQRPKPAK